MPEPELANLAVGGGYLWASNETKGTVYKADDHSGAIVETYETGDGSPGVLRRRRPLGG